jgi:hypothetical protein
MSILRFAVPALIVAVGVVITSSASFGKVEYTKAEKTACVTCHVTAKSKELNDTGKYYAEKKTLKGAPKAEKKAEK